MKRIIVCADDYAFDSAVSQGILDCVDAGRVSAVSCMSLAPGWAAAARAIGGRQALADFGLHLDVNEFAGYARRSLAGWIAAAYTGRIAPRMARQWVAEQLDAFEQGAGFAPGFVDGHQHVHQLPVLREAVLEAVAQRYGGRCALRFCGARHWRGGKAQIIGWLGAGALARQARQRGVASNRDFAGVYDFSASRPYGERVADWLESLDDQGLLMTHPARAGGPVAHPDAIRGARVREHAWWLSPQAGALLSGLQVQVARFGMP